MEQVFAFRVVGGDAVQLLVAYEEAALAIRCAAGGPDELAALVTVASKVAEVAALGVAQGDADAPSGLLLAAADDVETVFVTHGSVHRVVEALAFHHRHAHGVGVFQSVWFSALWSYLELPYSTSHLRERVRVRAAGPVQKPGSQMNCRFRVKPGSSGSPDRDTGASSISTSAPGRYTYTRRTLVQRVNQASPAGRRSPCTLPSCGWMPVSACRNLSEVQSRSREKCGQNPRFFSGRPFNSAKRLLSIQEASGERTAPLGKVKPALESKTMPLPSLLAQRPKSTLMLEFWFPVVMLAGGKISSAPSEFFSRRRASFSELNLRSTSSVISTIGSNRRTIGPSGLTKSRISLRRILLRFCFPSGHWNDTCHIRLAIGETATTAGTPASPPPSATRRRCAGGRCCCPGRIFEKDRAPRS